MLTPEEAIELAVSNRPDIAESLVGVFRYTTRGIAKYGEIAEAGREKALHVLEADGDIFMAQARIDDDWHAQYAIRSKRRNPRK